MTSSNSLEFFVEDLEIERIALYNLKAGIRQKEEMLGLDLEKVQ